MQLKKGDSVLVIGSGPIRIGQGCEFDYSCTQACRALRQEGLKVILVNPNPATIMTDPGTADTVYIEPLEPSIVTQIIAKERPTALLATMGGQEGLNLALELDRRGVLKQYATELLGITTNTIEIAEDREKFKELLREQNLGYIAGCVIEPSNLQALHTITAEMRFPVIIRASFTLGGAGGCIVESRSELEAKVREALAASAGRVITVEESIVGWKEFELEVMTDDKGTFVVVSAVENLNPMGVHTGDSVTVVPTFTLRDTEFQNMRDAAKKIFRALGMRIGGANIQFALHPNTGQMVVVEMNPRVSRSSALVSKATGYPIAHISTKLALGYSLDQLTNEITQKTSAAYEPVIDYVAVKIPRFDFEKLAPEQGTLGIAMKSVGEVLAFGSSFQEAITKAWRSLEKGFECMPTFEEWLGSHPEAKHLQDNPLANIATLPLVKTKILAGRSLDDIHKETGISMFFLNELKELFDAEESYRRSARSGTIDQNSVNVLLEAGYPSSWFAKETKLPMPNVASGSCSSFLPFPEGLSTKPTASIKNSNFEISRPSPEIRPIEAPEANPNAAHTEVTEEGETEWQGRVGGLINMAHPDSMNALMQRSFRLIDSCAGEFEAKTPYFFSSHRNCVNENRFDPRKPSVVILGSGPNRIGQGIEFDYACVHAVQTLKETGHQAVMVNCNPETVSTDYLLADKLYIEPIDESAVASILEAERQQSLKGVLLQFGGQSPLKLAKFISNLGVPILGSSIETIELCENRDAFEVLLQELGLESPTSTTYKSKQEVLEASKSTTSPLNYPLLLRPSFVIGGQGMAIVYTAKQLLQATECIPEISAENPVILQQFLEGGTEFDVDLLCDGIETEVVGVLRHLDPPGIHSGDSICEWLHPKQYPLEIVAAAERIALRTGSIGLINVQCVLLKKKVYVLEANPRCSRTVPFLAKISRSAEGNAVIRKATRLCLGERLAKIKNAETRNESSYFAFKFPVFPYGKFSNLQRGPGPEMHSLGEVMGHGDSRLKAFIKGALAAGWKFPNFDSIDNQKRATTAEGNNRNFADICLWFSSAHAFERLKPMCDELSYLLTQRGMKLDLVVASKESTDAVPENVAAAFAPDYFRIESEIPSLRASVATTLGLGIPAATSYDTAIHILSAFCLMASCEPTLEVAAVSKT